MLKLFSPILLSLSLFAAASMNVLGQNKTPQTDLTVSEILADNGITGEIKDKILQHIKNNFSKETVNRIIDPSGGGTENLILSEITYQSYNSAAKFYLLKHRGFGHWSETYVEYKGNLYTSLKSDDLELFLRSYDFLGKNNALNLFLTAYKHFLADEFALHPTEIVTQKFLRSFKENVDKKLSDQKFHDPILSKESGGATKIVFYSLNTSNYKIAKIKVLISPNYNFEWKSTIAQKEKLF